MKAWTLFTVICVALVSGLLFAGGGRRYTLSTPTNVQAVAVKAEIDVTWDAVSGATSYDVYRLTTGAFYTVVANVGTNSYNDTAVTNGQLTGYKIVAKAPGDSSSQSSPAVTTANIPAVTLTATAAKASVDLSWTSESYADTYNVYRGSPGFWTQIATNVAGTTYNDSGRTNGTTYNYMVRGVNNAGPGLESNQSSATPNIPAPTLTGTSGKASVILNWNSVTYADSYAVDRWIGFWDQVASGITATTYTHTSRVNGQQYQYRVRGVNSGSFGQASNSVFVDVYLPAPKGVKAIKNPSTNVVTVSWNAEAWADSYDVYRSTSSGTGFSFFNSTASTSINGGTATGGTVYYYVIYSRNTGGLGPKSVEVSSGGIPYSAARPPHEGACSNDPDDLCGMEPAMGGIPINLQTSPGASYGDPVNTATGTEIYGPTADLLAYNPNGPSAVFQRNFRSNQSKVGYGSPGLSPGWVHSYDVRLVPTSSTSTWDALTLVYPNGAVEQITPTLSSGTPTGAFAYTAGLPYYVEGTASGTTNQWTSIDVTWRDQTKWRFELNTTGDYALTRITDRMGHYVTLNWDSARKLTSVVDGTSSATLLSLTYDGQGQLDRVEDVYSRKVSFGYSYTNGARVLTSASVIVASAATSWTTRASFTYTQVDQRYYLASITVPSATGTGNATVNLNYDGSGRVSYIVDANGNRKDYTYNSLSTDITVKNSSNVTEASWTENYDANKHTTGQTDSASKTLLIEYTDSSNPAKVTRVLSPTGREFLATYDSKGNVTTQTTPRGVVITYTWDYTNFAFGRLISAQEYGKAATTLTYYEPSGLIHTITSPKPGGGGTVTVTFTYDSLGNLLTRVSPGNNAVSTKTTTYSYTSDGGYSQSAAIGQPIVVTDNLGHSTHYRYDSQGRVVSSWDDLSNQMDSTYNLAGDLTSSSLPATGQTGVGRATTTYDYLYIGGPLTSTKTYNESGTLIRQADNTYGKEGEILTATGTDQSVTYTYDSFYRIKTLSDALNQTTTYAYNSRGLVSQITYPGGETVQFTSYDDSGNLLTRIDGNSLTTNYVYNDDEDRLTAVQYPSASSYNISFTYDSYGRRDSMTDSTGTTTYTYGDIDELLTKQTTFTGLSAKTISYTYYDDGSRNSMTTPAGTYSYAYDGAGRLASLTNPYSEVSSWTYLTNDWIWTQTLGNGAVTTYTYNAAGQKTLLENRTSTSTLLSSFGSIGYDGTGNQVSVTANVPGYSSLGGTTNWTYNSKDRLTQEQSGRNGGYTNNFAYDAAGNPTTFKGVTQAFNSNNQQTGMGFAYDYNGNPTTYKGTTLQFDPENRMIAYGTVMTAGYDGDGLRAWKQNSSSTTYFLYDGDNIVCELDGSGALVAANTCGVNGLLSRRVSGSSVFYTFDQRGATVQRLDASQAVLSSHSFDAFGLDISSPADPYCGLGAQFGYYYDAETNLSLLTNRYYDAASGRFVTRDPISYSGGVNLYEYVGNNPINLQDRSGLDSHKEPFIGEVMNWADDELWDIIVFGDDERGQHVIRLRKGETSPVGFDVDFILMTNKKTGAYKWFTLVSNVMGAPHITVYNKGPRYFGCGSVIGFPQGVRGIRSGDAQYWGVIKNYYSKHIKDAYYGGVVRTRTTMPGMSPLGGFIANGWQTVMRKLGL